MNATNLLETTATWIGQTSWQASVLVALVLVVQWIFASKLSPSWRCGLWLLVVVRLILPVAPGSPLSVFNWVRLAPVSMPASGSARRDQLASGGEKLFPAEPLQAGTRNLARVASDSDAAIPVATRPMDAWTSKTIFSLIWLGGAVLFAAGLLWQYWRLKRRLAGAACVNDPPILQVLEEANHAVGLRRSPLLIETDRVRSPALFGCLRVRLLLPRGLTTSLTSQELRHVFLHEAAHLKRADMPLNWLITALQVLHWFNPILWFGFARLRADRELACDALALAHSNGGGGKSYAQTIIKLLEGCARPKGLPGLVGILEDKNQMKRRIKMIAKFQRVSRWSVLALLLMVALGIVALTDAQTKQSSDSNKRAAAVSESDANEATADTKTKDSDEIVAAIKKSGGSVKFDQSGRQLIEVSLWEPDATIMHRLSELTTVRKLELGSQIGDAGLAHLEGLSHLEELYIEGTRPEITDEGMSHLPKLQRLQRLALFCTRVTDKGVEKLKGLTELRSFRISSVIPRGYNGITDTTLAHLATLPKIVEIHVYDAEITDKGLAHLAALTNLTNLNLGANPLIEGDGLRHLARLTNLRSLWLWSTSIPDASLAYLSGLTNLESLALSGTEVTDAGMAHLRKLTKMRILILGTMMRPTLNLGGTRVGDAGLMHLRGMTNLQQLWLGRSQVTDAGLSHLQSMVNLQWLNLDRTRVTGEGLVHLNKLTELETLALRHAKATDAAMSYLGQFPKLRQLALGSTHVTDAGMRYLIGSTNLRFLELGDTQITDAGFEHLKSLSNLRGLALVNGTRVSDAAGKSLQDKIPELKVHR